MNDGKIELDTSEGKEFGFISSLFDGWLWKDGNKIIISMIISKHDGQGNFQKLLKSIWDKGYKVQIPTPLGTMGYILKKYGFKRTIKDDSIMGPVEIWEK